MIYRNLVILWLCMVVIASHQPIDAQTGDDQQFADAYHIASPSIVAITGEILVSELWQVVESGSGVVFDTNGHIITTAQMVMGAERLTINFFDGTQTRATHIATDGLSNLALLRVDLPAERLIPAKFGDSRALLVGQSILAIGTPFGGAWTLTSGIISTPPRYLIQTDMPLTDGGILINMIGEIIGISAPLGEIGINFATPSLHIQKVAQALITQGFVDYSYLGVNGSDMTLPFIEQFGLPNTLQGAIILGIADGAPASRAGILQADVILAIDTIPMRGWDDLNWYLAQHTSPQQTVIMQVYRDGAIIELAVQLGSQLTG
ncbi:MAG TPA: trypsin-like peptidase domain-containing protein [Aggregatilineales bacterium]|nr:trypsin-like peptidase domain-containing protein [Aggregatilineales bacterium]